MRRASPVNFVYGLVLLLAVALVGGARAAEKPAPPGPQLKDILSAVVELSALVPAEARTARSLGLERNGNGVVIGLAGARSCRATHRHGVIHHPESHHCDPRTSHFNLHKRAMMTRI
ncbi:MAG: hypothetical protein QF546_04515, partial [Alphaproteobacteria bacterium]|nr:hypothetical protein [Alphaproteobacteria bacterium]